MFCFEVDGFPGTYWMNTYGQIHSIGLYSVIPFIILAVANIFLLKKTKKTNNNASATSAKNQQDNASQAVPRLSIVNFAQTVAGLQPRASRGSLGSISQTNLSRANKFAKMNRTVAIITLLFIAFTLPVACASYFFNTLFATEWGSFLVTLLDEISFTYHAGTFFINYFSNALFKKKVDRLLGRQVAHEVSQIGTAILNLNRFGNNK
jgi:hypothetical protein